MSEPSNLPAFLAELIQLQVKHGVILKADEIYLITREEDVRDLPDFAEEPIRASWLGEFGHLFYSSNNRQEYNETMAKIGEITPRLLSTIGTVATEEMTDSVRHILIHMHTPGMTFGGIRRMVELSGIDTKHWPEWMNGRSHEHLNKAARAALLWHCMAHAAMNGYKD